MNPKLILLAALFIIPIRGFSNDTEITIGNGAPGMKVAVVTRQGAYSDRECDYAAIYLDKPETVGIGTRGAIKRRNPTVLHGSIPDTYKLHSRQLYPIDKYTAFTCEGISFDNKPDKGRSITIYRLNDGSLKTDEDDDDSWAEATKQYNLEKGAMLLGRIDDIVFYWVNFDKNKIYWKKIGSDKPSRIKVSGRTIDIYGVTRGITKKYCFVVFIKKPWFALMSGPRFYSVIEFDI